MSTLLKGKFQGIFLFLFTTALFFIIYSFFEIRFEENDDVIMALIASGKYSGTPDAHLVFSNIIYGYFLNYLYTINSTLEWYTIIQVLINIVSTSILSQFILKLNVLKFFKIILLAFLFSIFLAISIKLQFTYSAGILGIAGASLLYNNSSIYKMISGIVLLFVSSLVRFEAPLLVLLISMPLALVHIKSLRRILNIPSVWGVGVAFLIILGGRYADRSSYRSDSEWDYYWDYNIDRGDINDNPNALKFKDNLPEYITLGDYNLLLTAFTDAELFNLEVVSDIKSRLGKVSFADKVLNVRKLFKPYYVIWLGLMLIMAFVFLNRKCSWKQLIPILMYCILFGGLSYLALEQTVKNRVFVIVFGTYIVLLPLVLEHITLKKRNMQILASILITLTLVLNFRTIFRYDGAVFPEKFNKQHELLEKYLESGNKKITPYGTSLMLEYGNPFYMSEMYYSKQMFFTGWLTQVPLNKGYIDSFKFFVDGNGLYITKLAYKSVVDLVAESIKNNYGVNVHPEIVLESEKDYIIEFVRD